MRLPSRVLNAFRHLRSIHRPPHATLTGVTWCSTPFDISNTTASAIRFFLHLFKIERSLALHHRMQRHDTDKRFGFAHMTALTIVSKQSTKESLSTSWSAHSSTTLLSMRIVSESSSMCPGDRPTPVGYKSLPHSIIRICLRHRKAPLSI